MKGIEATMTNFSHKDTIRISLSLDSFNSIHQAPSCLLKKQLNIVVGVEPIALTLLEEV